MRVFQALPFSAQSNPCVMTGKAQTCSTLSWCRDSHIGGTGDDGRAFQVTQQRGGEQGGPLGLESGGGGPAPGHAPCPAAEPLGLQRPELFECRATWPPHMDPSGKLSPVLRRWFAIVEQGRAEAVSFLKAPFPLSPDLRSCT